MKKTLFVVLVTLLASGAWGQSTSAYDKPAIGTDGTGTYLATGITLTGHGSDRVAHVTLVGKTLTYKAECAIADEDCYVIVGHRYTLVHDNSVLILVPVNDRNARIWMVIEKIGAIH